MPLMYIRTDREVSHDVHSASALLTSADPAVSGPSFRPAYAAQKAAMIEERKRREMQYQEEKERKRQAMIDFMEDNLEKVRQSPLQSLILPFWSVLL